MTMQTCRTTHAPRCRRAGFSLVELLVVLAVISLLLAVMAPSTISLMRRMRMNLCKTNLYNLGRATAIYAANNDLHVPRDACDASQPGHYLFAACFMEYLGGNKIPANKLQDWGYCYNAFKNAGPILRCPGIADQSYVLTYLVNAIDHDYYRTSKAYVSDATRALPGVLTHLPGAPAEICYIIEATSNLSAVPYNNFTCYDIWHTAHMPFVGQSANMSARCITLGDMRHEGSTTLVFFDGHIEDRPILPQYLPVRLFNPLDDR